MKQMQSACCYDKVGALAIEKLHLVAVPNGHALSSEDVGPASSILTHTP